MKKSLISLAIAAGMAMSGAAFAEADVYGNVHISIDDNDKSLPTDELQMKSQTSSVGVKGSEDLGNGLKALFMVEFQINPDEAATVSPTITGRDQWVGLKGGMGTVKFGTMSTNWKDSGGKIDPLYRTALEGRGFMKTQSSALHGGGGFNRGRATDLIQYESPEMGGMSMVINTGVHGAPTGEDETLGAGFRYEGKGFMGYIDWIDVATTATTSESATKVGGKVKAGPVTVGAQFESAEDVTGGDYTFLSANYGIDSNNEVILTLGMFAAKAANSDSDAVAVAYNHKLSKETNVYVGYGDRSDDVGPGESTTTVGIRKKF